MLINEVLSETYVNAVGTDDRAMATKKKYLKQVWNILQRSYASIGGIKGKGFGSPEEMLEFPMWKMGVRNGKVHAVVIYKDNNGRKSVAMGTDGSEEGMWFISDIAKQEITRSYGEKSKAALGKVLKTFPFDVLKPFLATPERVQQITGKKVIPLKKVSKDKWPDDAKLTLSRFPQLIDYGYLRDIGGTYMFKILIGTPGKSIK